MNITILGAGGLGASLGGWLARAGNDVTLIFRRQAHVDAIRERGLIVTGVEEFTISVRATTDPSQLDKTDFLIVAVKNKDTDTALASMAHMDVGCVTSMQNSMFKDELLAKCFGWSKIIGSACFTGGVLLDYGKVKRVNRRSTYFGELDGSRSQRLRDIVDTFNQARLGAYVADDVTSLEWTKQAWWIPQAVLSALTRLPFVQVYLRLDLARLVVLMTREVATVARNCGSDMGDYPELDILPLLDTSIEDAVALVQAKGEDFVRQGMAEYKASMLLDVLNQRRTELTETAGYVVREAHKHNVPVPYLEFAYHAVSGIEQDFGK